MDSRTLVAPALPRAHPIQHLAAGSTKRFVDLTPHAFLGRGAYRTSGVASPRARSKVVDKYLHIKLWSIQMTVWSRHILIFDNQDAPHVDEAVELAGRLSIDYVPAAAPDIYLEFANGADAFTFKVSHPTTILNADNTAKLANVATFASISGTLAILSPNTEVAHALKAVLWCRDQAAEMAFNAALASLSERFVGPLPTI